MIKKVKKILLVLMAIILALSLLLMVYVIWIQPINSRTADNTIGIARKTEANSQEIVKVKKMPKPETKTTSFPKTELRSKDLSRLDLTDQANAIKYANYDSATKWPKLLPNGFDPKECLELGKDPGLHVRNLHKQGITGKGVSIGIIDQTLYTEHEEYKDRLKHYEEIHALSKEPEMHGASVSSLAVGKSIGVAPESHLYFIASALSENWGSMLLGKKENDPDANKPHKYITYKYYAQAIERFIELNKTLPEKEKVRVISISRGFNKKDRGYDVFKKALDKANSKKILVVTATLEQDYGIGIAGLGKEMMADPDDVASYSVGIRYDDKSNKHQDYLFVPMDGRTHAGTKGKNSYEYNASGGLSWAIPYLSGLYALAYQVNNEITPEKFIETAKETADSKTGTHDGKPFKIKYMVNPVRLIDKVKSDQ